MSNDHATSPPDDPPTAALAKSPSPVLPAALENFSYAAQTAEGLRLTGTIEAADGAAAIRLLETMHLRVIHLTAANQRQPKVTGRDPFVIFNERLAQLSKSGLPIEKGIRLIAVDARRGRMARRIASIARELEQGVPLAQAFAKHRRKFPPIYGKLLDLAVRGGDPAAILLDIARQQDIHQRLRATLWRSLVYPAMTLCGLLVILAFVGLYIIPALWPLLADSRIPLPPISRAVFWLANVAPYLAAGAVGLSVIGIILWLVLWMAGAQAWAAEQLFLPMPLAGPVLRFTLIARWIDLVRIGLCAGLELPAAIELAGDATASPVLRDDGNNLAAALAANKPLATLHTRLLPATVPMTLEFAGNQTDLPGTLRMLCELYQRQAELRLERIPAILTPLMLILIVAMVSFVMCGLLMPLAKLIEEFTPWIR